MVVRIVTYGARDLETAREWAKERAAEVRAVEGVEDVTFIQQENPDRVGGDGHGDRSSGVCQSGDCRSGG